jgi:TusA-related sulfurtransferase
MQRLDVRGEICPYPMLRTVQALRKLTPRDEGLVVVTDHAPCLETIPPQATRLGFSTTITETGTPEWTLTLVRER